MISRVATTLLVCTLVCTATFAAAPKLDSEDSKTLFAIGLAMSRNLQQFGFKADEAGTISAGMSAGLLGTEHPVDLQTYLPKIDAFLAARAADVATVEKEAGRSFREAKGKEKGAVTTESGLVYIEVEPGTGARPTLDDTVKLHYHGTLRDGSTFDSSVDRGEPASFGLRNVVACFSEGLTRMKVGGKAKIVCPPEIAYGDRGAPPSIKPGATLTFEIQLLDIVSSAATSPAP